MSQSVIKGQENKELYIRDLRRRTSHPSIKEVVNLYLARYIFYTNVLHIISISIWKCLYRRQAYCYYIINVIGKKQIRTYNIDSKYNTLNNRLAYMIITHFFGQSVLQLTLVTEVLTFLCEIQN